MKKPFSIVVFGTYLPNAAGKQRNLLTDALLRLSNSARRHGSEVIVYTSPNDRANGLIIRVCKALNLELKQVSGAEITNLVQDQATTYMLVLRAREGHLRREGLQDFLDTAEEYVNRIISAISPACEWKDLTVYVKDEDLMPVSSSSTSLDKFKAPQYTFERTGDYGDINSYIDTWFEGVRKEADLPYHDLEGVPPQDGVNTRMAAEPVKS